MPNLGARKWLTKIIIELSEINRESHSGNNFKQLSILYGHEQVVFINVHLIRDLIWFKVNVSK